MEKLTLWAEAFPIQEIFADFIAAGVPDHVFKARRELSRFLVIFFFFRGAVEVGAILTSAPTVLEIVAELDCLGGSLLSSRMLVDASGASIALISQEVTTDPTFHITGSTTLTLFRAHMAKLA